MNLIKLDATESTNLFLKDLALAQDLPDFTIVTCKNQTKGRGQMGTVWKAESGKNLTFSVLKIFKKLSATEQFKINVAVSLAIYDFLKQKKILEIAVKWPNDIMAGNQKICGILIENILQGKHIQKSIIGIGLNSNQIQFKNLDHATSMKTSTGVHYDLEELLKQLAVLLEYRLAEMEDVNFHEEYERVLFRHQVQSNFIEGNGNEFVGSIDGVEPSGQLRIKTMEGTFQKYGFKEIKMVY